MALHLKRPVRPTSFPLERPKLGNFGLGSNYCTTVVLNSNGKCIGVGEDPYGVNGLDNVAAISASYLGYIAIKSDGTCVGNGNPNYDAGATHQLDRFKMTDWSDIVAASTSPSITVGLKSDGTCVAIGRQTNRQISICSGWENIISVFALDDFIIGLKSDGSCLVGGDNSGNTVRYWSDIVALDGFENRLVGLKADGTCVTQMFNTNRYGTNKEGSDGLDAGMDVSSWKDIVAITIGWQHVAGLKSDGTCVASGSNGRGQCNVSDWTDIIAIEAGGEYTVGLKSDGTLVATGLNDKGQCNVSDLKVALDKKGLITSRTGINLLNYSAVNKIAVTGEEPSGTKRRLAFKVGDTWNKLAVNNGAATLSALPTQTLTADSVLKEGNTAAEVISATSIPDFAGKIVYPAIALYADSSATVMPTIGLKANATTTTAKYTQEGYSQEYHLSDTPVSIASLKADIAAKGAASAAVTVSLKNGDNWLDYIELVKAIGQKATDIKFKTIYTVTKTDGSESASLNNVTCTYTTSGNKVTNKAADVVTVTKEFTNDLVYIHAYVKHKPLKDAKINVYAALRPTPKKRDMNQIGTGSGETQTVKVDDVGINQDTLRLYYDGKAAYDFDYNTETSEITFKAAAGVVVSASYEYGWKAADWLPMTQGLTQNNDSGNDTTEYTYTVPAHKDALTVTAIRYELLRPTGHVSDNVIGIGTGTRQIIKLPHFAKKETIVCSGAWSYDYDSRLVTVVADKGTEIKISYDWIAEQPEVISIGAGWADK